MELRNSSHISVTGSLLVHALAIWVVAQQMVLPMPDPKPKVKVQVIKKEPPPPPEIPKPKPVKPVQKSATQPKQVQPQKPVPVQPKQVQPETMRKVSTTQVPKTQAVPQKPVQKPVTNPSPSVQPRQVTPKTTQPVVKPVQVQTHVPKTMTTATAIRHTTQNTQFKAPINPVPVTKTPTTPTTQTASLKTPVTTTRVKTTQAVTPVTSAVSESFTGESAAPMQTASLDISPNENIQPVDPVSAEPAPPGPDVQKALDEFNNAIWAQILRAKFYPKSAQMRRLEGKPIVKFTVEKDGSISNISINHSSRHGILDKAALRTIQKAAPFPEIPEILKEERIVLEVPISFILNR